MGSIEGARLPIGDPEITRQRTVRENGSRRHKAPRRVAETGIKVSVAQRASCPKGCLTSEPGINSKVLVTGETNLNNGYA